VQRRLIFFTVLAGLLLSLLGSASASAKTLKPSGNAVATRVGASFFKASPEAGERRALPLRTEHPTKLDQLKQKAARQSTTGAPQAPLSPASVPAQWDGLLWSDNTASNLGTPPDTTGAIGPSYYFEFVNSVVRPYNRTTLATLGTAQLDVFSGPTGRSVFDPQVQWDQEANRWIYTAISNDGDTAGTNFMVFGWSKDANPTGDLTSSSWCRYAIDTGGVIDDYDKLGHDANHIIIGSNVFTGNTFNGARIWALPKPANGSTACPTSFGTRFFGYNGTAGSGLKTADNDTAFTPVPANTANPTGGNGYVVAADDPSDHVGTSNQIMVWHVGGTSTVPTLVQDGNISVSNYSVPANVPQPGTKKTLDSSDTRLTQAVENPDPGAGGAEAVWTQHTINGTGGRSVIRWYELIPGNCSAGTCPAGAKRQEGNVSSTADFVFNGAISPTTAGNSAMIDLNEGSSADLVSVRVQSRVGTDTLGTMGNESTLITSAVNDGDFSCGPCRWGDYAAASPDPSNSSLVWGSNQYNGTASGPPTKLGWRTYNFAVSP
jgi:hypothetical protein